MPVIPDYEGEHIEIIRSPDSTDVERKWNIFVHPDLWAIITNADLWEDAEAPNRKVIAYTVLGGVEHGSADVGCGS